MQYKVRINRAKWINGAYGAYGESNGYGYTSLCNEMDMRCCLGFAINQVCNIKYEDLEGVASPIEICVLKNKKLTNKLSLFINNISTEGYAVEETLFTQEAIKINDDSMISLENREEMLIELFKENNIELTFYGNYPKEVAHAKS